MKSRRWFLIIPYLFAVLTTLPAVAPVPTVQAFTAKDLAYGSQGYDVYELQNRLRFVGYYWGKIDGKFGWDTYWSVRTFQYNFGLNVTGFVDASTKKKLVNAAKGWKYKGSSGSLSGSSNAASAASSPNNTSSGQITQTPPIVNGVSRSDVQLMAHAVYGEARGESFTGQVAIAAVILNRLKDPRFPHSVPAIIYQPGAFTAVADGQINLQPDASATKAVLDAVHGFDPALGAVYYFNPATATSPWIWSRPQIVRIGQHIFCR